MKPEITARLTKVTLEFAGKRRSFQLNVDQLVELQEITGYGPSFIQRRLANGEWGTKEISETIRLGMIGAGDSPADAERATERYVRKRPWEENRLIAWAIVSACLVGVPDEAIKKVKGRSDRAPQPPLPNGKLRFADIYGVGGAMGINVGQLSLWQVSAYWAGYVQAQGGDTVDALSDDEAADIGRWLDS